MSVGLFITIIVIMLTWTELLTSYDSSTSWLLADLFQYRWLLLAVDWSMQYLLIITILFFSPPVAHSCPVSKHKKTEIKKKKNSKKGKKKNLVDPKKKWLCSMQRRRRQISIECLPACLHVCLMELCVRNTLATCWASQSGVCVCDRYEWWMKVKFLLGTCFLISSSMLCLSNYLSIRLAS